MTRLSNRQYPMLKTLHDSRTLSIAEAQKFDQRPFRSMLIRKYSAYTGHGFRITKEGEAALYEFETTDIARKNPQLPLTAYFDYKAYGLAAPKKTRAARPQPQTRSRAGSVREFIAEARV